MSKGEDKKITRQEKLERVSEDEIEVIFVECPHCKKDVPIYFVEVEPPFLVPESSAVN